MVRQGSIRENLDPMGRHSDRELIGVLKVTRLWDILCGFSLSQAKGYAQRSAPLPTAQQQRIPSATGTPPGLFPRTPPGASGEALQEPLNTPQRHDDEPCRMSQQHILIAFICKFAWLTCPANTQFLHTAKHACHSEVGKACRLLYCS